MKVELLREMVIKYVLLVRCGDITTSSSKNQVLLCFFLEVKPPWCVEQEGRRVFVCVRTVDKQCRACGARFGYSFGLRGPSTLASRYSLAVHGHVAGSKHAQWEGEIGCVP